MPERVPWVDEFLDELLMFPAGPQDDQVDSFTQALEYLQWPGPWPNNHPILVGLTAHAVKGIGSDPIPCRERLDVIKLVLDSMRNNPAEIQARQIPVVLKAMADLPWKGLAEVLQGYTPQGFHSDLIKLKKAESKPGGAPFTSRCLRADAQQNPPLP
jgi:hypothetical protein